MKTIAVLIAMLMLMAPAVAMPPEPWGSNPDVCKISMDLGTELLGIYIWQNNATGDWEVKMGMDSNLKSFVLPVTFRSDKTGLIEIDFSEFQQQPRYY